MNWPGAHSTEHWDILENCNLQFQTEHLYDMWIVTLFPTGHLENEPTAQAGVKLVTAM